MIKSARIKFDKALGETPKAILIRIKGAQHWIPKSLCENFTTNKKLGGHVILPTFIINQIIDDDINKMEYLPEHIKPTWTVDHHTPKKESPIKDNTIQELKR